MAKVLIGFMFLLSLNAQAVPLKSEALKQVIADEIQAFGEQWQSENENVGSIWISSYEDNKSEYSFEIKEWKSKEHMVVDASFPCGSEYDESSFYGSCEVDVLKDQKNKNWVAIISAEKCFCEVENQE